MGCCFSRIDSKLVKLCKERKELIKDARDHQCSFAFAHMAYFQSLHDAENEFSNFITEAILLYHGSPSDTISTHLKEQFPQSENSSLGNSDETKDEVVAEDDVSVILSEFQSENNRGKVYYSKEAVNSKTCFKGVPHNVLYQPQVAATKTPEHLSIGSLKGITDQPWYGKIVESSNPGSLQFPQSESAGFWSSGNLVFPPYRTESFIGESQYSVSDNAIFAYKRSSMSSNDMKYATPSDNFTDNLHNRLMPNANTALFNGQNAFPLMNLSFYQNENEEATENYLMAFPPHYPWGYQMQSHQHNDISIWDYLNPFTPVENLYNTGFQDIDIQGVRESEGIPDLEDISDGKISSDADLESNKNSEECCFEAMHEPNENDIKLDQRIGKEKTEELLDKNNLDGRPNYSTMCEELKTNKRQQSSVQKEVEEIHESKKESAQIDENVAEASSEALVRRSTNLQEVYNKIKKEFDTINIHGNYVSAMLDAGKLHHQPGMRLFNGVAENEPY